MGSAAALDEAQSLQATPARLAALARHPSLAVRRAVVQNPNAPPEVLATLAARFPREFLENPVLGLLALGQPEAFRELLLGAAEALVKEPGLPASYVVILAGHPSSVVRERLARDPATPPHVLQVLAQSPCRDRAAHLLARNPNTPGPALTLLARLYRYELERLMDIARNPGAPLELLARLMLQDHRIARRMPPPALARLALAPQAEVRDRCARHRSTPPEALAALAEATLGPGALEVGNRLLRAVVAGNPGATAGLLARLAADGAFEVRQAVAGNPSAPAELLAALARDAEPVVRASVPRNRNTSEATLAALVRDPDPEVRYCVPDAALPRLAQHPDWEVRAAVAGRERLPLRLRQRLARDPHPLVRAAVGRG